ncbi:hypothetical protein J6590_052657 [Homalodisca vitripennis]|nr:hypothetical protein J6590_052657 [Homalodisca vitripennis]
MTGHITHRVAGVTGGEPRLRKRKWEAAALGHAPCGGEGLKIKEIKVPDVVLNGTKPVVLDCDYVLDDPSGLVVKWFFNNHPAPVYQWIFKQKPQVLGVLKGKINLNYRATNEDSTMYRAIEIITPTMDLSGEYKCLVSTFDKEVSKSKKMVVYGELNIKILCIICVHFGIPRVLYNPPQRGISEHSFGFNQALLNILPAG